MRFHTMRAALAALAACLAACSGGGGARSGAASPPGGEDPSRPLPSPVPEIVARVNGEPIRIHQILPLAAAGLDRVSVSERDRLKPRIVREALGRYVERELLLQEALARGVHADDRQVQWAYDQMRQQHPDDGAWRDFLARQAFDEQALRAELRAQETVSALLSEEARSSRLSPQEIRSALVERLRARARIEILL